MAETAWTEDEPPPKKKSIPTWLWFCGAGCLALVILGVVAGGLMWSAGRKMFDADRQWPNVAKILPYDEQPSKMKLVMGMQFPIEQYTFADDRGYQIQIQRHGGADGSEARKKMFGTDPPEFPQNLVVMKFEDLSTGTVEVQGRGIPVLRMKMAFSGMFGKMVPEEAQAGMGHILFADLTPEDEPGLTMMQVTKVKKEGGPVSDEELRAILEPFHVGPKR